MTLSHFASRSKAEEGRALLGGEGGCWEGPDRRPPPVRIAEVYVLRRGGDGGQFRIAATVPLGAAAGGRCVVHDPPVPFGRMPAEEEGWVREERMRLKARRKGGRRRGARGRGGGGSGRRRKGRDGRRTRDTPEEIEQKRAARRAKREALERDGGSPPVLG